MKKIKIIVTTICLFGLLISLTYCKKFLQQDPISTVAPDKFWKDKNDAGTWMAGIYNQMQTTLSSAFFDWGEVRSDNVRVGGTGNAQQTMISNTLSGNDADINGITTWTNLYTTISLCNYGIKYFPGMIESNADGGAAIYRDYLGQCYALRALMYFYGLRVWGKLPLLTDPIENLSQETEVARSPVDQVRARIESDIDASLQLIGSVTTQRFYMQKAAVYALQTDVAMWFQDYNKALTASQNCITESKCQLVTNIADWKNIFLTPATSSEAIFNLFWSVTERGNGVGVCSKVGSASNTNQYEPRTFIWQRLKDHVDPVTGKSIDGRFWAIFDTLSYNTAETYDAAVAQMGKYSPWKANAPIGTGFTFQGNSDCSVAIPVYRFADVLLLRAEALAHTNNYQGALDIVNNIRKRVGYTVAAKLADYSGDITAGIERTILEERQLELIGEGKRWFDLCRIGKIYDYTDNGYGYLKEVMNPILAGTTGGIQFSGANMGRVLFPINSAAFNANHKLLGDQNPPYDE
ncbi:MAG: RagB/SusD family nutrient uptake outer membrane protein [Niabella sp.]|nr:RagB/SusD family nutrient uptake outer membrane protein [Niabella sp.]